MFYSVDFLGIFRGLSIMTFGLFVNCAVSSMIACRKKLVGFNYRVLKTAHRQLEQLEAIKYTYDTIRRDRRVCELNFTLIS